MLSEARIRKLVREHGKSLLSGRNIKQIIEAGNIPFLKNAEIFEGKSFYSVIHKNLVDSNGNKIRLRYRKNQLTTKTKDRGKIPFKDQVLCWNSNFMLSLIEGVVKTSEIKIPGLKKVSPIVVEKDLEMIKL